MRPALLLIALAFFGCASSPPFVPSQPLAESKTLGHGLLLCSEYHPSFEEKQRVSSLFPIRKCVEELRSRFLFSGRAPEEIFYQELNSHLDILQEQYWSYALAEDYLEAIQVILKSLWRNQTIPPKFKWEEKRLAQRLFPKAYAALNLSRLPFFSSTLLDPEFETLLLDVDLALSGNWPCTEEQEKLLLRLNRILVLREDLGWIRNLGPDSNEQASIQRKYLTEKSLLKKSLSLITTQKKQSSYCKINPFIHKRPS